MNKLVIIGANESINNLIQVAKNKGYETHVFAWSCGDIGEKNADYFYPISIENKEEILEKCKEIKPDGIASITSDFAVSTVNYVGRALGLTCNSEKTDAVARNKYLMRKALKEAGLYTPFFVKVSSINALDSIQLPQFPLIVKPTDRWSSKGVSCVKNTVDLKEAVQYAIQESLTGEAIIEGFIDGPEYSCECISYNGNHTLLAFTQKRTTGFPHYIETGHDQPSDLSQTIIDKISPQIKKALDALDIKNGASHVEFKITDSSYLGIIEIGARMGGDCIGPHLVHLSTGIDYIGLVIDVACSKEPKETSNKYSRNAHIRFILNDQDIQALNNLKLSSPESIMHISDIEIPGTRNVVDSSTRFGYYIYVD